jgi:hypothetical protein
LESWPHTAFDRFSWFGFDAKEDFVNSLRFRYRVPMVVAVLLLVFVVIAGLAAAQQSVPATEPGAVQSSSESVAIYDSALLTDLPPDENPPAGDGSTPRLGAATFSYYTVSGATLRGRSSAAEYAYDGSGCVHTTAGTGSGRILNTELTLPDGAVIKYLRVYYKDASATDGVEGYITRYTPGQATNDLVHTGSTNAFAGGYGYVVSSQITETVNNNIYAYTLIGWPDANSVNNQICGLRVAYYAPLTIRGSYLPNVLK